jgi:precorrin-6Y C5,15-methyltransferase (decarboxylating)
LPTPDAIFLGGGVGDGALFEAAWRALRPGGRLVANAVTLEGEAQLMRSHREQGGDLMRIAVAHAEPIGTRQGWRPLMPVTQLAVTKPREGVS